MPIEESQQDMKNNNNNSPKLGKVKTQSSPKISNPDFKQKRSLSLQPSLNMNLSQQDYSNQVDKLQTSITISPDPIPTILNKPVVSISSNIKEATSTTPTVFSTVNSNQSGPLHSSHTVNFKLSPGSQSSLSNQENDKINSTQLDSSPPPSSSSETNRTLSISDPDLYYMSLPPVKINQSSNENASIQQQTSTNQQRQNPLCKSTTGNIQRKESYSNIRSIRFEQKRASKSMRVLPASLSSSAQRRHLPHHQSMFHNTKFVPDIFIADNKRTASVVSKESFRKMRCKSTNLSHMRLAFHSDTDISDTMEINNNYLDNNNASDNEAMAILPIEAREILMQEEEERKSRLAKESTSLLRIPGLGTRRESKYFPGRIRKRVILKNGNINLCPEHVDKRSRRYLQDTFTTMVDIRWRWNLLVFSMGFFMSWFGFSIIWWLIAFSHSDFEHLYDEEWTPCVMNLKNFASALLFSIETQHTIGYGSRFTTEECPEAMFVMCLQSITGVMIQCFMVGFVFAKLSRPQKRSQTLMFSRYAIVNTRDSKLCIMFRVGDLRDRSHIIGAKISAQLIRKKITEEGEMIPYFHQKLNVKFDDIDDEVFLIWPAIIVHIIDKNSPFYTMNVDDMAREKFEIIAILEGTVESTGQTVQARTSYLPSEILWGHRFEQLIRYRHDTGEYLVDYSKFNNTFDVDTPLCSAKELEEELKRQEQIQSDEEDDE